MKAYLSGPMSGIPNYNRKAFVAAAKSLRKAGHSVVSPIEMDDKHGVKGYIEVGSGAYQSLLSRDLKALLTCNAIHTLDGWEKSRGASLEVMVAKELGYRFLAMDGSVVPSPRAHHQSILVEAERIIHGPRNRDYGPPRIDMGRTGRMIGAMLPPCEKCGTEHPSLTAEDVCKAMICVKMSRLTQSPTHYDSILDIAGYAGTYEMILKDRELTGLQQRTV